MARHTVLGLGGFDHNGSVAVIEDGLVHMFLEAERVTRDKNVGFTAPEILDATVQGLDLSAIDHVALADEKYVRARRDWLEPWLDARFPGVPRSVHRHHRCHGAAAFFTSTYESALVISVDGRGDGLSAMAALVDGRGRFREVLSVPSASSLGRLWWATAAACGLGNHFAAGKAMAWAAYGAPRHRAAIDAAIELLPDGGFRFPPPPDEVMRYRESALFAGWLARLEGAGVSTGGAAYPDIAASVQRVTEEVLEHLVGTLVRSTGVRNVCLGGGVALNGLANQRLIERGVVDSLHVPYVPDDRGLSLGAAVLGLAQLGGALAAPATSPFLGRAADPCAVPHGWAVAQGDPLESAAELLASGGVIGRFAGRDEAGPRALGNRSLLASPVEATTCRRMNERKGREPFRPFGCAILGERASEWLDMEGDSPFMLRIVPVRPGRRARVPAVVHVDGTTRPQTVTGTSHPALAALLRAMDRRGHPPLLLNTSFNGAGEPIAHRASEAAAMAIRMGLDGILSEDQLLVRGARAPTRSGS